MFPLQLVLVPLICSICCVLAFPGSCPNFDPISTSTCLVNRQGPVIVLKLNGSSTYEMGEAYGRALTYELHYSLDILTNFYQSHGGTYQLMLEGANEFQERYTTEWDQFLKGMAAGSGLTYDDCKILNAMETLMVPDAKKQTDPKFGCAFAYVPSSKTLSGSPLIGRNYDYPPPFGEIAKHLIVTILHQENNIPTAIIGMPGQIYCPSCLNAHGYFLELNNGAPSGGGTVAQSAKPSMLIKMVDFLRSSSDFDELSNKLSESRSDYSLIVNAASPIEGASFEYSAPNSTVNFYRFGRDDSFVSTNFFLNPVWQLPSPTDKDTFIGVTRRENLLELLDRYEPVSMEQLKEIMDVDLIDGGAKWFRTIYQILYDYKTRLLSLKVPSAGNEWVDVDLNHLLFA